MEKLISTGAVYSILDALRKIISFDGCMYGDVVIRTRKLGLIFLALDK
jgi:hypothetical protein